MAIPRHNINFTWREYAMALRGACARPRQGACVQAFEQAVAAYLGVREAIAFATGSAALYHGLQASRLPAGSRVIVPAYEFPSVVSTLRLCALTPVFAPVDPATGNLTVAGLEATFREGVVAVLVAHIHGTPAAMTAIAPWCAQRGLLLIEDCAHAMGASLDGRRVGTFGDWAMLSFGSGKNLVTGIGGMVVTSRPEWAERLRARQRELPPPPRRRLVRQMLSVALKAWLSTRTWFSAVMFPLLRLWSRLADRMPLDDILQHGTGTKLAMPPEYRDAFTDAGARLGLSQLARLDALNAARRRNAERLREKLADRLTFLLPAPAARMTPSGLNLAVRYPEAMALRLCLLRRGIDTRGDYLRRYESSRPHGEPIDDCLYLPNHPGLTDGDLERVVQAVRDCCGQSHHLVAADGEKPLQQT